MIGVPIADQTPVHTEVGPGSHLEQAAGRHAPSGAAARKIAVETKHGTRARDLDGACALEGDVLPPGPGTEGAAPAGVELQGGTRGDVEAGGILGGSGQLESSSRDHRAPRVTVVVGKSLGAGADLDQVTAGTGQPAGEGGGLSVIAKRQRGTAHPQLAVTRQTPEGLALAVQVEQRIAVADRDGALVGDDVIGSGQAHGGTRVDGGGSGIGSGARERGRATLNRESAGTADVSSVGGGPSP